MDNIPDLVFTEKTSYFGVCLSCACDVNNDGYDDVLVGAKGFNNSQGKVSIFFGGETMKDSANVELFGTKSSSFGWSVSSAGDVNNDGFDDVIVGAYTVSNTGGEAYIYLGATEMDDSLDVTMRAESTRHYFGKSVASAGDINFDGYDDVIVGASGYITASGRVYVFLGDSTLNYDSDVILTGESTNTFFGESIAGNLDVNNDGINDILIGAYKIKKAYLYTMYNVTSVSNAELDELNFELFQNYPNPFNPAQ